MNATDTLLPGPDAIRRSIDSGASDADLQELIASAALLICSLTDGRGFSTDRTRVHPAVADAVIASVVRLLRNRAARQRPHPSWTVPARSA